MIASPPSWSEIRKEFLAWEECRFPPAVADPNEEASEPGEQPPAGKSEEELPAEEKALADAALDAEAASRVSELIASQDQDDSNGDAGCEDKSRDFDLYSNVALVGHDPTPRIVAIEFSDPNCITEYHRRPDGSTRTRKTTFKPFIWEQRDGPVLALQFFALWSSFRQYARYGAQTQCAIRDPIQQYLTSSGRTLFKGMRFEELRRMQLDIETACALGFEFPSAERDQIIAIALSDSTGWEELILIEAESRKSEAAALRRLTSLIIERDPDVIEGHNLFKFDLPYIMARAKGLGVKLTWGRDGSLLFQERKWRDDPGLARMSAGGQYIDFPNLRVRGRHIVDTFLLAQAYDANARSLPSYGLKAVAAALGVQEPDRVILDAEGIQRAYLEDRASFTAYALGDVRETRSVSAILSQSYFLAAQIYPLGGYQNVLMAGEARRTNSLLLRAYYRAGCPIPRAPKVQEYRGALCEVHKRGVIRDVWHADIASLYPTTMLLFDCLPKADTLAVIRAILTDLRDYRLAARAAAESAVDPKEKTRWEALQGTFKIAINAIYGYLGTPGGNFADFDAAGMVTAIGRCLMARMRDWLAARGATIIEIDTDGIFFSPPAGASEGADLEELKRGLSAQLPRGMTLNFDRHYVAMFSYKSKNCALLADDGKIMVKGGSLRSRALEPFLRRYQTTVLQLLLAGREAEVPKLYNDTLWALQHHEFPLEELAESKTLRKSLEEYEFKLNNGGNPMAQYEVATSSEQEYLRGDKVLFYYIAPGPEEKRGSQYKHAKSLPRGATPERDEDVELYIKKLNQVAMRLDEFAPGRIPWRPERKNRKKTKPEENAMKRCPKCGTVGAHYCPAEVARS